MPLSKAQFAALVREMPGASDDEILAEAKKRGSGVLEPGNVDLTTRPHVKNPDGSTSTVRSISIGEDGKEVLIPTVSDDGRVLSNVDAVKLYRQTGRHLGKFRDAQSATAYAQQLHESEAKKLEEPGVLSKVWAKANEPLTDLPSRVASKVADTIDQRSLDENPFMAKVKGFFAGATQGAGDVATSLTSPVNIGLTALGLGGEAAGARGMLGISKAARVAEGALNAPLVAEGAKGAVEGVKEGDFGKAGAGALEAAMGASGIKGAMTHSFPVQKVAEAYAREAGIPVERLAPHQPVKVNPETSKRIADSYEAMPHAPQDPAVAKSYDALGKETSDQFQFLAQRAGVKVEPWKGEGQPYGNSKEMMADIEKNNHLWFFPSEAGFGSAEGPQGNPLLKPGKSGNPVNDEFRAVHDYFGHAKEGHQFGPNGEENAWATHSKMFSPEAVPAMTTETRGQNSWVNFGRHLRRDDGAIPKRGEPGFVEPAVRPFAEQKTGLLPAEFHQQQNPAASLSQSAPVLPEAAVAQATPATPRHTAGGSSSPVENVPTPASVSPSGKGGVSSPPVYNLDNAASMVDQLTQKNNGASFNLYKGDLAGTKHYAVSVYPDRGVVIEGKPTPDQIRTFVGANQDLLQDPKNSIGTWFNPEDKKTYLDISVTTPDLKEATQLGKQHNQLAIFDLGNFETISLQPNSPHEFVPVGEEPPAQRPTFKEPQTAYDLVASQGGRNLQRVANEQEARGIKTGQQAPQTGAGLATAMSLAGPAAIGAIPDDPDSKLDDYGRIGIALASGAGLMAGVRKAPLAGTKLHAVRVAGQLLAGVPKQEVMARLYSEGVPQTELKTIHAAAKQILEKEVVKAGSKLTPPKKLAHYFQTGQGDMKWYDDTFKSFQELVGKDAEKLAGFFTATSINATVKSNATLALKAYAQWKAGEPFKGYLPAVIKELNRVAQDQPLAGRKLDNFRKAIIGDPGAVVVDRWMLRAFGYSVDAATPHTYDVIENAVKQMAKQQGVTPRQMQAAIWFGAKNQAEAARGVTNPSPPFQDLLRQKMAQQKLSLASGQ